MLSSRQSIVRALTYSSRIYWVGPGAGAIIAVVFYKFIKMLEYEIANVSIKVSSVPKEACCLANASPQPGQDATHDKEAKAAEV